DLLSLDPETARYSGTALPLPEQIDMARAALGDASVYRRRGVQPVVVARANVEVDIDMENTESGVYLWGCLVGGRDSPAPEYVSFVTWEPMTADVESANSLAFWRWLADLRNATRANGMSFRAYCWNAPAENRYLRRLGLALEVSDDVKAFIASD